MTEPTSLPSLTGANTSGYLRYPSLHKDTLVFKSEDDLWLYSLSQHYLRRLTFNMHVGNSKALFSPDGNSLALVAMHEASQDIYLLSLHGGPVKRLTYCSHVVRLLSWSKNNIRFISHHNSSFSQGHGFEVSLVNKKITPLGLGPIEDYQTNPLRPDQHVLQRNGYGWASWKRYQGGSAAKLWVQSGPSNQAQILNFAHNTQQPLWHQNRIYFLSDHQDHGNIYSCNSDGSAIKRHTHHQDFYVRSFCIDHDTLIYSKGGDLFHLSLNRKEPKASRITLSYHSHTPHKDHSFEDSEQRISSLAVCPKAEFTAFIKRGHLCVLPSWQGGVQFYSTARDLRYKHILFHPHLACFVGICDNGTHDELHVLDAQHCALKTKTPLPQLGRILKAKACPTSPKLCLATHTHSLELMDINSAVCTRIASSDFAPIVDYTWSPDGAWIAYSCKHTHQASRITLLHVETQSKTPVSPPRYFSWSASFSPDGRFLFYLCNDHFEASMDPHCFQYYFTPRVTQAYVVALKQHTLPPFVWRPGQKNVEQEDCEQEKSEKNTPPSVSIDLNGIATRQAPLPLSPNRYTGLHAVKDGVIVILQHNSPKKDQPSALKHRKKAILYDFKEHTETTLYKNLRSFGLSQCAKWSVVLEHNGSLRILKTGESIDEEDTSLKGSGKIELERIQPVTHPELEWQFIFQEAWRLQKDFYWDAELGGVDWNEVKTRYTQLLPKINTRHELNDLIAEMQGELGTSHAYIWGGEHPDPKDTPNGYLAASTDFQHTHKAYRITHIIPQTDPTCSQTRSPLLSPGIELSVGDLILSVNGMPACQNAPLESLLVNTAEKTVELLVATPSVSTNTIKHTKSLPVTTLACTKALLYNQWVERNRSAVEKASRGRIGYIHIPDMQHEGFEQFMRSFLTNYQHDALIIDVRFNRGGHISTHILQKLALKRFGMDITRWHKAPFTYPTEAPSHHLAALCNEHTASDGDMFAHAFKHLKLGPLIGKRTWGGVIGIEPRFVFPDGGIATQPEYAAWLEHAGYSIENHGVDPDIEVDITPAQAASGQDPQLDTAISLLLKNLDSHSSSMESQQRKSPKPKLAPKKLPKHC